jgi:hypothetical protein
VHLLIVLIENAGPGWLRTLVYYIPSQRHSQHGPGSSPALRSGGAGMSVRCFTVGLGVLGVDRS